MKNCIFDCIFNDKVYMHGYHIAIYTECESWYGGSTTGGRAGNMHHIPLLDATAVPTSTP